MSKQVTLTEDQAKLVMQCLDLAVKHGGLNAAAQILPVATEIERQLTATTEATPNSNDWTPSPATYAEASAEAVAALGQV